MEIYIAVMLTILVIGKVIGFFLRSDDVSRVISRQDQICGHLKNMSNDIELFKNRSNDIEASLYKIASK